MANGNKNVRYLLIGIILLIVVVGAFFIFSLKVNNGKNLFTDIIKPLFDPAKESSQNLRSNELDDKIKLVDQKETDLTNLKNELDSLKAELDIKEKNLTEREQALLDSEKKVKDLESKLSGQVSDLKEIVKIYENMQPEKAAAILSEMDPTLVAQIIRNMKKEKSAEILAAMDTKTAVEITNKIIK